MRIYLDNCCYNRPFDDQTQPRIREETDAVSAIITRTMANDDIILSSDILFFEVMKIKALDKRRAILSMIDRVADKTVALNEQINLRKNDIMCASNIHDMDAAHLACAEFGDADIFLTTDDKLIKACGNLNLKFRILNPATYFKEVIENGRN
ncbi:MAG: hypothetical protein IJQ85_03455 [Selenomonadaceae bacterium]|nr:hypothetical protein [Selenomonadaceae bacterium]